MEDIDSQGDGSSQPDTISIASRTSQNTVDSDKVGKSPSLPSPETSYWSNHPWKVTLRISPTVEPNHRSQLSLCESKGDRTGPDSDVERVTQKQRAEQWER